VTTPSGVVAGRPQPQTTSEASGGPFVRHSQAGRRTQYVATPSFGGLVAQPLVAAPGYTRGYRVLWATSGGSGTNTTTNDNFGNIASLIQLKDSFGTPLIVAPGYEAQQVIQLFGGQFGINQTADVNNLPSLTALAAGVNNGTFQFSTFLPLEFAKAYGVISSANASLLPTLQFNVNTTALFYGTTAPAATTPSLTLTVDQDFYWLPEGVSVEPPGLGTTCQWVYQPANPTIGSASTLNVQLPRLGGYLSCVIAELRDAGGVRASTSPNAGWGSRTRFLVDGVPLIDTLDTTWQDDMAMQFGVGSTVNGASTAAGTSFIKAPAGIRALSFKDSLSRQSQGLFDTGEAYLSTNPGTQLEFAAAPWGGCTNAPFTLNAICGQIVPSGALIQGLPEV
jgi:hypothetical protein